MSGYGITDCRLRITDNEVFISFIISYFLFFISFSVCPPASTNRRTAASCFYALLNLETKGALESHQDTAFTDIDINLVEQVCIKKNYFSRGWPILFYNPTKSSKTYKFTVEL